MSALLNGDDNQVNVLFLTGQPGAGKTAVAKELSELLRQIREPHAVIDLDELCRGVLAVKTSDFNRSLALANLTAVWGNFFAAGVRRLILARIVESLDDIDQFGRAIPNAQLTVCLLHAQQATVQQRITDREAGTARNFLLTVTPRIAERIAQLELPGIQVNNDQRPLTQVAREILERAGWPYPLTE
jgi:adenylylsulfate kinase-like enzyme